MGEWTDGLWAWNLRWSRPLDAEELSRHTQRVADILSSVTSVRARSRTTTSSLRVT
ncbi:hypothetical protein A2U01_0090587, partial [Trifolium medium]|nr:hypothetical protein [Trifolium medium]